MRRRPEQAVARQKQFVRLSTIAVRIVISLHRKNMQVCKARPIRVDTEHRAIAITPYRRRSIQGVARQNQSGLRTAAVETSETMQVRKTRPVGVDTEHRTEARTAAPLSRPIQNITG